MLRTSPHRLTVQLLCLASIAAPQIAAANSGSVLPIERLQQAGGVVAALDLLDDVVVIGRGPCLALVDISDPTTPQITATTPGLPQFVRDVTIHDGLAYVAAGGAGLAVADLSNVETLTWLGRFETDGWAEDVLVVQDRLYVANGGSGIAVFDLEDPREPVRIGTVPSAGDWTHALAWTDGLLLSAEGTAGLRVTDAGDLTELARLTFEDRIFGVDMCDGNESRDTTACVAAGRAGLAIVDVSDPAAPQELAVLDTPGEARHVAVQGDMAFVADGWSGVQVIDISDPTLPGTVGSMETAGWAVNLVVREDQLLIADNEGGLVIADATTPRALVMQGTMDKAMRANGVAVDKQRLFLAAGHAGLQIYSVSFPGYPTLISEIATAGNAQAVALEDDLALVADGWNGLSIFDVSTVTAPRLIAGYDGIGFTRDLAVADGCAFLISDAFGLIAIDFSDPESPVSMRASHELPSRPQGVATDGRHAFVVDRDTGMHVFEVDNGQPAFMGLYGGMQDARDVAIQDDMAYVVSGRGELMAIDIADPAAPVQVGGLDVGSSLVSLSVRGRYVYAASRGAGLQVFNVCDPRQPVLVGASAMTSDAGHVVVQAARAFVADGPGGLLILDVHAFPGGMPACPHAVGTVPQDDPDGRKPTALCGAGTALFMLVSLVGAPGMRRRARHTTRQRSLEQSWVTCALSGVAVLLIAVTAIGMLIAG